MVCCAFFNNKNTGSNASSPGKKKITWSVINDYGMSGPKYTAIIQ
jgi:P pilus assembly chaperone PapD